MSLGRFGLVWFGLVWFGLVWFGSVRFGSVRFGFSWVELVPEIASLPLFDCIVIQYCMKNYSSKELLLSNCIICQMNIFTAIALMALIVSCTHIWRVVNISLCWDTWVIVSIVRLIHVSKYSSRVELMKNSAYFLSVKNGYYACILHLTMMLLCGLLAPLRCLINCPNYCWKVSLAFEHFKTITWHLSSFEVSVHKRIINEMEEIKILLHGLLLHKLHFCLIRLAIVVVVARK